MTKKSNTTKTSKVLAVLAAVAFVFTANTALAAKGLEMNISTKLLQCGKRAEMQKSCQKDARCCVFLSPQQKIAALKHSKAPSKAIKDQSRGYLLATNAEQHHNRTYSLRRGLF